MLRMIKQPWLHFLAIGSVLYGLQWYFAEPQIFVIAPPSQAQIDVLREQWISSNGRIPSEEKSQQLIAIETNREILFQEALRQQLHLADEEIKKRLILEVAAFDPDYDLDTGVTSDEDELLSIALAIGLHKNDLLIRKRLIQQMVLNAYESVGDSLPDDQVLLENYLQVINNNDLASIPPFEQVRETLLDNWRREQQTLALEQMMGELREVYQVRSPVNENSSESKNG